MASSAWLRLLSVVAAGRPWVVAQVDPEFLDVDTDDSDTDQQQVSAEGGDKEEEVSRGPQPSTSGPGSAEGGDSGLPHVHRAVGHKHKLGEPCEDNCEPCTQLAGQVSFKPMIRFCLGLGAFGMCISLLFYCFCCC